MKLSRQCHVVEILQEPGRRNISALTNQKLLCEIMEVYRRRNNVRGVVVVSYLNRNVFVHWLDEFISDKRSRFC
jgi:hypothetical protein